MNLSPEWVDILINQGFEAVHWHKIGKPTDNDEVIFNWARQNEAIVFTHDLDFGALLKYTHADGPSVIQVRTQDVTVKHLKNIVITALNNYTEILKTGALIIIDEKKLRIRILPL